MFLVAIPVALLTEELVAVLTLERLGTSVRAQMIHDVALFVKEFVTEITLEHLVVSASLRTFLKRPSVKCRRIS